MIFKLFSDTEGMSAFDRVSKYVLKYTNPNIVILSSREEFDAKDIESAKKVCASYGCELVFLKTMHPYYIGVGVK